MTFTTSVLCRSREFLGRLAFLAVMASIACGLGASDLQRQSASFPTRAIIPLNGTWEFQRDKSTNDFWKPVSIPGTMQDHEGNDFHGIGWYRRPVIISPLPEGARVWVHFDAVATVADVFWDGQRVGRHLGGWTPFRCEITHLLKQRTEPGVHELKVRVDEKLGHNTQGFLPIIEPHWGGIWQDVQLVYARSVVIDDLTLKVWGNTDRGQLEIAARMDGASSGQAVKLELGYRLLGQKKFITQTVSVTPDSEGWVRTEIPVPSFKLWSPAAPRLYEVRVALPGSRNNPGDQVIARAAFRKLEAVGDRITLNGQPVQVRGVLNWGYYPPRLAPYSDEPRFRKDLAWLKASGFNLMKFCLWVPPRRYLEMADESGVLTWMEYPTWHPKLTPEYLGDLRQEFREFFHFDRNHPSVILRSLTCETGAGADLGVIRELYEMAHREIPNALVEDDSSWIGWNRIHDFYDDHPYGNNHTWVKTLADFREHIQKHGIKPLVLGEAIAADTWVDQRPLLSRVGTNRPYWLPGSLDAAQAWEQRMAELTGRKNLAGLREDSLRYGMLMRKYQVEAFRRELPNAGYVISVIRDFPLASMGLLDHADRSKWSAAEWAWQRDTMILLQTANDGRSFRAGETARLGFWLSHQGAAPIANGKVEMTAKMAGKTWRKQVGPLRQPSATTTALASWELPLPEVAVPSPLDVTTTLKARGINYQNVWRLWVFPKPANVPGIQIHSSLADSLARELFPGVARSENLNPDQIIVAARFDDALAAALEKGARVLLLPDGEKQSLPLSQHWFLRGAPWAAADSAHEWLVDLQHFDLAGPVVPDLAYLDQIDSLLMLWDTHDIKTVKTHGLVFETRAASGRLLVSALRHDGTQNAAGAFMLGQLLKHLADGAPPQRGLAPETWRHLKEKLHEDKVDLTRREWRFKPDPAEAGARENWAAAPLDDTWKPIKVGQAWEGQGWPALDRWAWYRLTVDIPDTWNNRSVYLSFEGVDDMYELYVDGQFITRRGDALTKKDTFNEKFSHDLTRHLPPGQHEIAVRVYDWYGAGGIFRPVALGTTGFAPGLDILR